MFFEKRKARPMMTLNVTALIDISALILIFLIMESYFGESSIVVPAGMTIPKSVSKESVENAARVIISGDDVQTSFLGEQAAPLKWFHNGSSELNLYKEKIKAFVAQMPSETRQSGALLNIIADKTTPYRDVFDVISVFREAGFQSILFVAQANK